MQAQRRTMKSILIVALFVVAPAFVAENASAQPEEAIKAVLTRVDSCVAKKDSKCLGELFADDATFAGQMARGKLITGKAEIIKFLAGMMEQPGMEKAQQQRTIEKVRLIGQDRALVDCSMKFSGATSPEGRESYHTTALLKREGDKWVVEDVRSYVVARIETPKPELPDKPAEAEKPAEPAQPDGEAPKS